MQHVNNLAELAILLKTDLSGYEINCEIVHDGIRIDLALTQVTKAIKNGDRSAVILGYTLLMEDPHLPFGKLIKSNFARAFKHQISLLTEHEKFRLAGKTAELLSLEYCPREVEDYCRLVKKMGEHVANRVVANSRPVNEKARSLVAYLGTSQQKGI
jgi:hypothetical protein